MSNLKVLATIEAEHLNPQTLNYFKVVLEPALSRNGVKVTCFKVTAENVKNFIHLFTNGDFVEDEKELERIAEIINDELTKDIIEE